MALTAITTIDLSDPAVAAAYLNNGNFSASGDLLTAGQNTTPDQRWFYYERLEFTQRPVGTSPGSDDFLRADPRFIDNTNSRYDFIATWPTGSNFFTTGCPGEFDRVLDVQKLYAMVFASDFGIFGSLNQFAEIDPVTHNILSEDVWSNVAPATSKATGAIGTTQGYWTNAAGAVTASFPILFESRNEMLLIGTNQFNTDGSTIVVGHPVLLSLITGLGVSLESLLGNSAQTLFGDTVNFQHGQFVDDDDSTVTSPKGRIFMFSRRVIVGSVARYYVKIHDWNPDGVVGLPNRVHGRQTLLSRIELIDGTTVTPPDTVPVAQTGSGWFYHRPTNRIVTGPEAGTPVFDAGRTADENWGAFWSLEPEFDAITGPHAITNVETNDTARFGIDARGTLGERIAGVNIAWTLERSSTFGEIVDTTGVAAGGAAPALANIALTPGDAITSPVTLLKAGVPLTETTNYSIVRSTGVITFVAPEPTVQDAGTYIVEYDHFPAPASPSHGTLLDTSSTTDATGRAETRVRYIDDDDLVDQDDFLTATATNV